METQNLTTNRQNLQQKSGTTSTIKTVQAMVKAMKMVRVLNS